MPVWSRIHFRNWETLVYTVGLPEHDPLPHDVAPASLDWQIIGPPLSP